MHPQMETRARGCNGQGRDWCPIPGQKGQTVAGQLRTAMSNDVTSAHAALPRRRVTRMRPAAAHLPGRESPCMNGLRNMAIFTVSMPCNAEPHKKMQYYSSFPYPTENLKSSNCRGPVRKKSLQQHRPGPFEGRNLAALAGSRCEVGTWRVGVFRPLPPENPDQASLTSAIRPGSPSQCASTPQTRAIP